MYGAGAGTEGVEVTARVIYFIFDELREAATRRLSSIKATWEEAGRSKKGSGENPGVLPTGEFPPACRGVSDQLGGYTLKSGNKQILATQELSIKAAYELHQSPGTMKCHCVITVASNTGSASPSTISASPLTCIRDKNAVYTNCLVYV